MNVGRNDPCPCSSKLKYKKCCLQKEWEQEQKENAEYDEWMKKDDEEGQRNLKEYEEKLQRQIAER